MADNWYELIQPSVKANQGDILRDFPIIINDLPSSYPDLMNNIKEQEEAVKAGTIIKDLKPIVQSKVQIANVVILTQGCLIAGPSGPKVDQVTIGVINDAADDDWPFITEVLSTKRPAYHLLSKSFETTIEMNYQIVDFTNIYTVSLELINSYCQNTGPRLRLKSPYVEELSQRFGLFFSKVGLPNDTIDKADLKRMTQL